MAKAGAARTTAFTATRLPAKNTMPASSRRNKDGSTVRYVSIAHNERSPGGPSVAKVLLPLGREDRLDIAGLRRLVGSINRWARRRAGSDADAQLGAEPGGGLMISHCRPAGQLANRSAGCPAADTGELASRLAAGRRGASSVRRKGALGMRALDSTERIFCGWKDPGIPLTSRRSSCWNPRRRVHCRSSRCERFSTSAATGLPRSPGWPRPPLWALAKTGGRRPRT